MPSYVRMTHALTGRPAFIDPFAAGAIVDMVEVAPTQIQGAPPRIEVVGTIVIVGGEQVPIRGEAEQVHAVIEHARNANAPLFTLDPAFGGKQ